MREVAGFTLEEDEYAVLSDRPAAGQQDADIHKA